MAEIVVLNGINYTIPDPGDQPNWGTGLTPYLVAVAATIASNPSFMQFVNVASSPTAMVSGKTYLVNTGSIAIQMNLPTPAQNAWVIIKDSGFNAYTNNITVHRAGSEKIDNVTADFVINNCGAAWVFMSDGTDWFSVGSAGDVVLKDISDGNRYRLFMNGGVLSTQQVA
jgi:hypothetical protein